MCDFYIKFADSGYNEQINTKMKMANIVAVYNAFQGVLKNAFEDADTNVTYYNCFCRHNLREPGVYLTKEMTHGNDGKNCIVAPYMVSYGCLTPIKYSLCDDGSIKTNIHIFDSKDVENYGSAENVPVYVATNRLIDNFGFHKDDIIVFLSLLQKKDETTNRYYTELEVSSFNLSIKNTENIGKRLGFDIIDGCLGVRNAKPGGYAWVHVGHRQKRGGWKHVNYKSTQRMLIVDDGLVNQFSSFEAFEAAAKSYGCKKEDPEKLKNRQNENRPPISPFI